MTLFIAGLALFFAVHLVPTAPALRARWVAAAGEARYRRQFALLSLAGLALVIVGYAIAPRDAQLFAASPRAQSIAPLAMVVSFILLAAANMKTHLRARLRHPMLIGVIIWATVHLLGNGDVKGTLLFGSFLFYAVVDLASALGRGAVKPFVPQHKHDIMAIVGGLIAAAAVMLFHRLLFGVPVVWWSL